MTLVNSLKLRKETKEIVSATFDTKIVNLNEDGFETIYMILLRWCKFLGIKEAPEQEEMMMILMFIKKNFGEMTGSELSNAFNLAVARKLDVDPNHYQNFSPLYVGGILTAYKDYRGQHITQYRDKLREKEEAIASEAKKPSKEELQAMRLDSLLKIWDEFKEAEDDEVSWQVHVYYDLMADAGLFADVAIDEKQEITGLAKASLKQEAQKISQEFKRNRIIEEIDQHSAQNRSEKVLNRCKMIMTQRLFEKLVSQGLDLREKLNLNGDDRFEATAERGQEDRTLDKV